MNTRKGFTLVELLVVIAILAILATVSVVGYTAFIQSAEEEAANTELNAAHDAIITALTLNKTVELELADGTVAIFTRSGNSFTVTTSDAMSDTIEDLKGVEEELVAKLSVEGNVLVYAYDSTSTQYNVETLKEYTAPSTGEDDE